MFRYATTQVCGSLLTLALLAAAGCNDAGTSGPNDADNNRLPLLSVGETPSRPVTNFNASEPTEAEPTPAAVPNDAEPTPAAANDNEITPAEAELAKSLQLWAECEEGSIAADIRRTKLKEIIDRTSRAIDLTRGHAEEADVLNLSAITRANARVELELEYDLARSQNPPLIMDRDEWGTWITQADRLAQDADTLFEYDATSMATVETAYRVVELSRELAERHAGEEDQSWASRYSLQARLFAQRFPQEGHRAPMNLAAAGVMCERAALVDEARNCYTALTTHFIENLAAIDAAKAMIRIDAEHAPVVGEELIGLAGETLDGEWLDLSFPETVKVIVFWRTDSPEFREQCERFSVWKEIFGEDLQIIAVNLDTDESLVREFVETNDFPAIVLFPNHPQLRGENHPIAKWFEVNAVPEYWLIDTDGTVNGESCEFDQLNTVFISAGLGQPFGTAPR